MRVAGCARPRVRRHVAGGAIEIVDVFERIKIRGGDPLKGALDRRRDVEKTDAALEKGMHRSLVGGVEHGGTAAAAPQGVACQAQRRKAARIGRFEGQAPDLGQIEPLGRSRARPGQPNA